MVKFELQSPDGKTYEVEAPEGATQEQVFKFFKQSQQLTSNANEPQIESSAMGFLNKGIANSLGTPVDLVTAGLNKVGMNIQNPVGGSKSLSNLFEMLGAEVANPEEEAKGATQQIAEGVGGAAGALLPFGAAAKIASGVGGVVGNVGRSAMNTLATKPIASTGIELASGAGSGVGGYTAEQIYPNNPMAKTVGQLVGGVGTAPALALSSLPTKVATNAALKTFAPFTKKGGMIRAEDRIKGLVPEAERGVAASALKEPTKTDLTPAQKTGQAGLLALEKEVLKKDIDLAANFRKRSSQNVTILKDEISKIKGSGNVDVAKEFAERRIERLKTALTTRTQQAVDIAEQRVAKLPAGQREEQSSIIAREELEKSLQSARSQENQIWSQLPNVDVDISGAKTAYKQIMASTPKAQRDDIPNIARKFLHSKGVLGKNVKGEKTSADKLKEVQGLRSKLLEEGRRARFEGNYNKARISNALADSLLDDMSKSNAGKELNDAIAYSRELNEKFTKGTVGKLLGSDKVGGEKVAAELTLQSAIGGGGVRGGVAYDDLVKASDTPDLKQSVEQYLRVNFQRQALNQNGFNAKAAEKFTTENATLLDKFPEFKKEIDLAINSTNLVDRVQARQELVLGNLGNKRKSVAAQFIGSTVDKEIASIVASQNPAKQAYEIRRLLSRDKTGEAIKGMKAASVEYLIKNSKTASLDFEGENIISGQKLLNLITKDSKHKAAVQPFLSVKERDNLAMIAKELSKVQQVSKENIGGIINDAPNKLLETVARVAGAQIGGKLGAHSAGGSLQSASIASSRAKEFLGKLISDKAEKLLIQAVQDPELMEALLTNTTTAKGVKLADQRLNAWLGSLIAQEEEE